MRLVQFLSGPNLVIKRGNGQFPFLQGMVLVRIYERFLGDSECIQHSDFLKLGGPMLWPVSVCGNGIIGVKLGSSADGERWESLVPQGMEINAVD